VEEAANGLSADRGLGKFRLLIPAPELLDTAGRILRYVRDKGYV